MKPGPAFSRWLQKARMLHFSGIERDRALSQVLAEARQMQGEVDVGRK